MSILVRHAMTEAPQTLKPDMSAADAAGLMKQLDVGVIPVAEEERLIGLVTDRDLVTRVMAERRPAEEVRLGDIMTSAAITVTPDTQLSVARDLMAQNKIRRLPVLKQEKLVGILSLGDVAVAGASERAVGQTLEEISESPSTTDMNEGPERGTPDRVLQARENRA
ncbi:MAG TPA: CBS domain-containing protein [Actinomycetota bacterium]|nr:CBS domain-containing protein [Actinomycetota bacterium]